MSFSTAIRFQKKIIYNQLPLPFVLDLYFNNTATTTTKLRNRVDFK